MEQNPEADHCLSRPLKRHKASSSLTTREIISNHASDRAYDVFLNFRGPDSRDTVTDALHHSLTNAGFRVFLDDEEIRKGEVIEGELLAAITNSSIYIPIFSKDYASSKWCLRELAKMIDCWEIYSSSDTKKTILPIFYDVDVSKDVKLRSQVYLTALQKHKDELGEDIVKPWEDALRKVTTIKGWNLKDHGLTKLADLINKEVFSKLTASEAVTSLPDRLVGIDKPVEDIMELLEEGSPGIRFIVIHGMGGIGKTTLAEAVFKKISSGYQGSCFLKDVRRSTSKDDMVKLQEKLLKDTLNLNIIKVSDNDHGICMISKRLRNKKVLIVLDDVDKRDHLLKLAAKSSWFGPRSRIIITTRNTEFLPTERDKEYYFHGMEKMESRHALQLFCRHAFEMDNPPPNFCGISFEIVDTTGGLPLSLQVIGSSLYKQDDRTWKFRLMKLKKAPHKDVQETLMISYQALEHEQQQIFLDIACLFNDEKTTYPFYFWEACELYPDCNIEILVKRSLIKVADDEKLWMHDQLRDFGRAIAQPERPCLESQMSTRPSRFWSSKCALNALRNQEVSQSIIAIKLGTLDANCQFVPTDFARAESLKFLELAGGNFEGDFENILQQLGWLSWFDFPPRLEATNLDFKNLVVLKIKSSDIDEDWGGWGAFMESKHLKVLHLEGSKRLTKTPNFSALMHLEILILRNCKFLKEIDISINKLKHLKCLEISGAYHLTELLPSIGKLTLLVELNLSSSEIKQLPDTIGGLESLEELDLSDSGILCLPETIGDLECLNILRMRWCPIKYLPDTIGGLESLEELDLSGSGILCLPETIGDLECLNILRMRDCPIKYLPDTIGELELLEELDLSDSEILCLPETIGGLECLNILRMRDCPIKYLPDTIGGLESLEELDLSDSGILCLPETIGNLKRLKFINLSGSAIKKLPKTLLKLEKFERLDVGFCKQMDGNLPEEIGGLSQLRILNLRCVAISKVPSTIDQLSHLEDLVFHGIHEPQELLKLPTSLINLSVDSSSLEPHRIPDLSYLTNLVTLSLLNFTNLVTLSPCNQTPQMKWLERLTKLEHLTLILPNFILTPIELTSLSRLQSLHINCSSLQSLAHLPSSLVGLHLNHVMSPIDWQLLSSLSNLFTLKLIDCRFKEIKVDCIEHLHYLCLFKCKFLERLSDLSGLKVLQRLEIGWCDHLVDIEGLGELESLQTLELDNCDSIQRLPDLSRLKKLKELLLTDCKSLESIPEVDEEVPCHLTIYGCDRFYYFEGPYSERHRAVKHEYPGSHFEGSSESEGGMALDSSESEDAGRIPEASSAQYEMLKEVKAIFQDNALPTCAMVIQHNLSNISDKHWQQSSFKATSFSTSTATKNSLAMLEKLWMHP